jgi:hopanoid biosynthesis associated protein HpnK
VRSLIVNADDFGFTQGVNRAVIQAHTEGIVTSTTLMATGPAFEDAVRLARQTPSLSVGCHVVLIDGEPVLDLAQLPTITTEKANGENSAITQNRSARFRDGLASFAVRAFLGRISMEEIEAETTAQIRKIQAAGIHVSHVDSHKHTHLFPAVMRPVMRAAQACGVQAIRNPFGPRKPLKSAQLLARPSLWTRYAEVRISRTLSGKFRGAAERMSLATPDGTLGVEVTGTLDHTLFRAIAEIIPEGTWEFVCHPGYNDADLQRARTRLRESRETELAVLTMPEARTLLARQGISLISYRDLISR